MKNVYRLLIATTAFILVASCTPEVEDAFNKPSAARIAESIKNTKDILTAAPNGWRIKVLAASVDTIFSASSEQITMFSVKKKQRM